MRFSIPTAQPDSLAARLAEAEHSAKQAHGVAQACERRAVTAEARVRELEAALLAEREACAAEADHWQQIGTPGHKCGEYIAAVIRGRSRTADSARTALDDLHQMDHEESKP